MIYFVILHKHKNQRARRPSNESLMTSITESSITSSSKAEKSINIDDVFHASESYNRWVLKKVFTFDIKYNKLYKYDRKILNNRRYSYKIIIGK